MLVAAWLGVVKEPRIKGSEDQRIGGSKDQRIKGSKGLRGRVIRIPHSLIPSFPRIQVSKCQVATSPSFPAVDNRLLHHEEHEEESRFASAFFLNISHFKTIRAGSAPYAGSQFEI